MAGPPHLRNDRRGAADWHRVALVLQRRAPKHGQRRADPRPETEDGRVNSTTKLPQSWGITAVQEFALGFQEFHEPLQLIGAFIKCSDVAPISVVGPEMETHRYLVLRQGDNRAEIGALIDKGVCRFVSHREPVGRVKIFADFADPVRAHCHARRISEDVCSCSFFLFHGRCLEVSCSCRAPLCGRAHGRNSIAATARKTVQHQSQFGHGLQPSVQPTFTSAILLRAVSA